MKHKGDEHLKDIFFYRYFSDCGHIFYRKCLKYYLENDKCDRLAGPQHVMHGYQRYIETTTSRTLQTQYCILVTSGLYTIAK